MNSNLLELLRMLETIEKPELPGIQYNASIPSVDTLKEIKELEPALQTRLFRFTEDEAVFRRFMIQRLVDKSFRAARWNQVFALLGICMISILVFLFMREGHAREGKFIAIGVMGTIASLFIIQKLPGIPNRKEKK
ncbi:hypothetical protein [Pseudobacter ginsenosidimutans]|uniref:DUF2335 domain-containing protein n=1 Tax=Pseudobacter ginsenosidimutans TaxID=661488 RepID=A0A4Q7MQL0_9BACT|nr:hypothetical protein [Pseudobacter ginsenosidimutans]QEC40285.1 hypothetical protein FSB84_00740 [Pseudobacter ginsenosidimutans]RZS69112.1 hypothetical protein EV199_4937 [Pseudobacter ginsenosidimutans]